MFLTLTEGSPTILGKGATVPGYSRRKLIVAAVWSRGIYDNAGIKTVLSQ